MKKFSAEWWGNLWFDIRWLFFTKKQKRAWRIKPWKSCSCGSTLRYLGNENYVEGRGWLAVCGDCGWLIGIKLGDKELKLASESPDVVSK